MARPLTTPSARFSFMGKLYVGLLLVVFGGIVFHAPLSVFFSSQLPDYSLFIKSWKEILMGIALLVLGILLTVRKKWSIFRSNLFYLIAAFAAINFVLIPAYFTGLEATVAGLLINLRYFLFFVLVYAAITLYPQARRWFVVTFIAGALIVVGFAILQSTVLPHDILASIGYGKETIAPFLTVDENMNYIRINSTLRGPNPLGAFAIISLAVALALWLKGPKRLSNKELWVIIVLGLGSVVALWSSYSRSAALGAAVAVGGILLIVYGHRLTKVVWAALFAAALVLGGSLVALRDTDFVSHVILHEDPNEGNDVNSNDGHVDSLVDGTGRLLRQPLGAGIGSTGSASLFTQNPVIIENQYLFVAHETGWFGLAVFLGIYGSVLWYLWKGRREWLALSVFASGVGLAFVGVVLPVWADDTVSIIWWGLAAVVLARSSLKNQDALGTQKVAKGRKYAN